MSDQSNFLKYHRGRLNGRQSSELIGLCKGLIADGKIVQSEVESLYAWLIDQETGNSLVEILRTRVGQMLKDETLDTSESEELTQLVHILLDDYSGGEESFGHGRIAINELDGGYIPELLGLCRGLIADGKIAESETRALRTWLIDHEETFNNPVAKAFREKLNSFWGQNAGDTDRTMQLLQLLSGLVGGKTEVGECLNATTLWLDDPPPEVVFAGRKFCLTGKFFYGSRIQCEREIQTRQGICQKSPTRATDYLVIGSYAEGTWIQSAYGRKIEKAVTLRTQEFPIRIVSEGHWLESIK